MPMPKNKHQRERLVARRNRHELKRRQKRKAERSGKKTMRKVAPARAMAVSSIPAMGMLGDLVVIGNSLRRLASPVRQRK